MWPHLPSGIISRHLPVNGLDMHILEAFPRPEDTEAPLVVLLHGFPELSYSWRKIILPLAHAGFHVVAPDQRGFGKTCTQRIRFDDDLGPYTMMGQVADIIALTRALGYAKVEAVVGHDSGAATAAYCALIRPDIFSRLVLMSQPFSGPPAVPFDVERNGPEAKKGPPPMQEITRQLAQLDPPRQHYQHYYSTALALADMDAPPQGMHDFLRGYFHSKSGSNAENWPRALPSFTGEALAALPEYYVMPLGASMPAVAAAGMPSGEALEKSRAWMPDAELAVFADEWTRTGFQGGLNHYRTLTEAEHTRDLVVFAGSEVVLPALFIAGAMDWGIYQKPNAYMKMREVCPRMRDEDVLLVVGAGHWVQQERPEVVVEALLRFLRD